MHELESNELISTLLEPGDDLADKASLDAVRLTKFMIIQIQVIEKVIVHDSP